MNKENILIITYTLSNKFQEYVNKMNGIKVTFETVEQLNHIMNKYWLDELSYIQSRKYISKNKYIISILFNTTN